ncbi:MAG: hypothetical protein V4489_04795 [Chlamydiota bacterium]
MKITPSDLNNFCLVTKAWKRVIDSQEGQVLWREVSIGEGIPVVQGKSRYHKNYLKSTHEKRKIIRRLAV